MDNVFLDFLKTEKLRFLELDMPIWKVKKHFPKMFDENLVSKTNTTRTFGFKSLVLYFYKKHLMSFEIDFSLDLVQLPEELVGHEVTLDIPRKLEGFIELLGSLNLSYEKFNVETYSFENESEKILSPNEGIIKIKIGESIYAKFLEKRLLSIRKAPNL